MRKLFILSLTVLVLVSSCENEETEEQKKELAPAEASEAIRDIVLDMDLDVADMIGTTSLQAIEDFSLIFGELSDFENGRASQKRWMEERLEIIRDVFANAQAARTQEDEFQFDDIKGIWEWNAALEQFDKTAESDIFIASFPAEDSGTNNAELTVNELEFVTIIDMYDGFPETDEELSRIVASLKVDNEEQASVDATATWDDFGVLLSGDISLTFDQFVLSASFDDTQATSSTASASLSKNGDILISVDGGIDFFSEEKDEAEFVEGSVRYANLKIEGSVNLDFEWPEEGEVGGDDINDFVNLDVLIDDVKVGEIIFIDDVAYIEYNDGAIDEETVEEILEQIIDRLEDEIDEFEEEEA